MTDNLADTEIREPKNAPKDVSKLSPTSTGVDTPSIPDELERVLEKLGYYYDESVFVDNISPEEARSAIQKAIRECLPEKRRDIHTDIDDDYEQEG